MPEGDTIYRTADVMRRTLRHDRITAARSRPGGARLERVVGARVAGVGTRGKHLLVGFDHGLTLHTHLHMHGSWHRYRPGERWRRSAHDAVAVLETDSAVAVCFEAPTVELIDTRALPLHPVLSRLGPDLLDDEFDMADALGRLGSSRRSIGEALLDQRLVAGIGNVYRSELLALARVDPFAAGCDLPDATLRELLEAARTQLRFNTDGEMRATVPGAPRGERWVYRRAGLPCRRCGTRIRSATVGRPVRRLYWCPDCQAPQDQSGTTGTGVR
jgi:endonuclease-8